MLSWSYVEAFEPRRELNSPTHRHWVEPFEDPQPESAAIRRERIELAWIAAPQRILATQRAAIVLKDMLAYTTAEIAEVLDLFAAAVNSALQRVRATLEPSPRGITAPSYADRSAAEMFAAAFTPADIDGLRRLLADDVRFTMPP